MRGGKRQGSGRKKKLPEQRIRYRSIGLTIGLIKNLIKIPSKNWNSRIELLYNCFINGKKK